jgi:hypothetical protein
MLTDLRTPVPFTLSEIELVQNCGAMPQTSTEVYEITVGGTVYRALPATITFANETRLTHTWEFPDLLLTLLTPGETITFVFSPSSKVMIGLQLDPNDWKQCA